MNTYLTHNNNKTKQHEKKVFCMETQTMTQRGKRNLCACAI